jgi:hypothetical protein
MRSPVVRARPRRVGRVRRFVRSASGCGVRAVVLATCTCLATLIAVGGCAAQPRVEPEAQGQIASAIDAFSLLREAADHEALYTLAGGLKPMSTGVWRGSFVVEEPDLDDLRSVRAALAPLRNDIWYADVQVFDNIHDGERSAHAFVVHRGAMARMIERFSAFWSPWGITACTHPSEVVAVVDRMPKADRWRGYGYLFGYPSEAVDFFIDAGLAAEDGREVGPGKDREFVQIPTYAAETGRFTYAVPLDHVPTPADKALMNEARRILAAYTQRRDRMFDTRSMTEQLRCLNSQFGSAAPATNALRSRLPATTDSCSKQIKTPGSSRIRSPLLNAIGSSSGSSGASSGSTHTAEVNTRLLGGPDR